MKKLLSVIIILFYTVMVQGQQKHYISIEGDAAYYYHCWNTANTFNYGFSFLVSNSFRKMKVSTGLEYATKFSHYSVVPEESDNYLNKKEFKLYYLNIPFLFYAGNDFDKRIHVSAMTGLIINKLVKFTEQSYYVNNPPDFVNRDTKSNVGLTFRLGAVVSIKLAGQFFLNITPFGDYKFILTKNDNDNIPDNHLSLGMKVGVEYVFGH